MSGERKMYRVGELRQKPDKRPAIFTGLVIAIIVLLNLSANGLSQEDRVPIVCGSNVLLAQIRAVLGLEQDSAVGWEPDCYPAEIIDAYRAQQPEPLPVPTASPSPEFTELSGFAQAFAEALEQERRLRETSALDFKSQGNRTLWGADCGRRAC